MPIPQLLEIAFSGPAKLPATAFPSRQAVLKEWHELAELGMVCQKKPKNGIKLESCLKEIISFCAIWKVQVPGEVWVVISAPCSPVLFFSPTSSCT